MKLCTVVVGALCVHLARVRRLLRQSIKQLCFPARLSRQSRLGDVQSRKGHFPPDYSDPALSSQTLCCPVGCVPVSFRDPSTFALKRRLRCNESDWVSADVSGPSGGQSYHKAIEQVTALPHNAVVGSFWCQIEFCFFDGLWSAAHNLFLGPSVQQGHRRQTALQKLRSNSFLSTSHAGIKFLQLVQMVSHYSISLPDCVM